MGEFEFACTEYPEGGSGRSSELSRIRIDILAELISVGYTLLVIPPDNIDYCVIGPIRRNYPYLYYCLDRKGLIKGIQAGVYIVGDVNDIGFKILTLISGSKVIMMNGIIQSINVLQNPEDAFQIIKEMLLAIYSI